jgi:hypothetical protein
VRGVDKRLELVAIEGGDGAPCHAGSDIGYAGADGVVWVILLLFKRRAYVEPVPA